MGPTFTITLPWLVYAAFSAAVLALIACAFWLGRLDRRDGRVFAGIRASHARFDQMRAIADRSRARLAETLSRLAASTAAAEPYLRPDLRRIGDARAVIDVEPEHVPVPDEQREVEPDDDGYPPDLRAAYGAGRLPFEPRDNQREVWSVNREPGVHRRVRARGEDTQQFSPAEVLEAAGIEAAA